MPLNSDLTAAETLVTLTRSTSSTSNSSNTQSGGASSVMSNLTSNSTDDSKVLQQSPEPIESDDLKTCFFPLQLHDIVSDEANADMIRWLPNGKAFVIADKKRFANEVLPKCFVQNSQFTSFTRKLTRWRFNRVPRGPLIGAYYHDLFVKDKRELCYHMSCKSMTRKETTQPQTTQPQKSFAPAGVPSLINMPQGMQPLQTQAPSFFSLTGIESKYPFGLFGSPSSIVSSESTSNLEELARIELDIRRIELAQSEKARMAALREEQMRNGLREAILRAHIMNVVRNAAGNHFS